MFSAPQQNGGVGTADDTTGPSLAGVNATELAYESPQSPEQEVSPITSMRIVVVEQLI